MPSWVGHASSVDSVGTAEDGIVWHAYVLPIRTLVYHRSPERLGGGSLRASRLASRQQFCDLESAGLCRHMDHFASSVSCVGLAGDGVVGLIVAMSSVHGMFHCRDSTAMWFGLQADRFLIVTRRLLAQNHHISSVDCVGTA